MAPSRAKKMQVKPAKTTVVIDRAVVAESRATGDEVEVEVVAGGVVGDGHAHDDDDDRREQDAEHGVGGAVVDADARADREIGEERDGPEGGRADGGRAPAPEGARHISEGIVLEAVLRGRARVACPAHSGIPSRTSRGASSGSGVTTALRARKPVMSAQIAMAARTVEVAAEPPSSVCVTKPEASTT